MRHHSRTGNLHTANLFLRYSRLLIIALLVLCGAFIALCISPFIDDQSRLTLKAKWSRALLHALGIKLDADLKHVLPGSLLIANHISWVDIFVINALLPATFVAKEEVRHWPLIGWLAARNDTIFLRRGSRGHARIINAEIADVLKNGKFAAVFPEGSTTDGRTLLHFHAALIQPALLAGRPVIPLAISYWQPDGKRSLAPRYDGDISLWQCIVSIIGEKKTIARLVSTPPLGLNGEDRRQVSAAAREAIAAGAELPPVSPAPETTPGLPA
jgi:1-acyl-sn-glycerol-3-phosphate acyltransferase